MFLSLKNILMYFIFFMFFIFYCFFVLFNVLFFVLVKTQTYKITNRPYD